MSPPQRNPTVRVFFALWPTAAERGALAAWQAPLKGLYGGRMMRSETLHSTLVFVGEIEPARLEPLRRAGQEACAEGFDLRFTAARFWGRNHIVYAAPDHVPPPLAQLVGSLEQSLARRGFTFDPREYKPHITLLRNARWTGAELKTMQPVCWRILDFALMESVPQGELMGYRTLARFPLKAAGCT